MSPGARKVKRRLSGGGKRGMERPVSEERQTTREERLAAKLRENLRRRKAQARAQHQPAPADGEPLPKDESNS